MALSADVCGIYLLKPDRLWKAREEAFFPDFWNIWFQDFGIHSSFLEFRTGMGYIFCGCVKCRFFAQIDTITVWGCVKCRFFVQIDTITPVVVSNAAK